MTWTRRSLLAAAAALPALPALAGVARAGAGEGRLVVLLLRGGLDGLAAVPPVGDPGFERLRGAAEGALPLDGAFALHPALAPLHPLWAAGELSAVHAVGSTYTGRSHFEAQNLLEAGGRAPHDLDDGWLGRAVALAGGESIAIGKQVPLLLRGPRIAASLDPRRDLGIAEALETQLTSLYADDPLLGAALAQGLATRERAGAGDAGKLGGVVGKLLAASDGPQVAVAELAGFDTHTGQDAALRRGLGGVADAIVAMQAGLGDRWRHTAVVVLSEFGRRVSLNGTGGTDHGAGGVALLAGGAVRGGRVHAEWPGLAPESLLEARDLRPTLDVRALGKSLCTSILGLDPAEVDRVVFPGSNGIRPLEGVFA